jgi:lipopolysaccharide heptosyltransferase I
MREGGGKGRGRVREPMTRFLLVRTGALGDIVHGLPVASALKQAFPFARIHWIVEERYADLLRCVPCVEEVIAVRFQDGWKSLADPASRDRWRDVLRRIRQGRYDVTIDMQGLIRSGLIAGCSRAPVRIGFPWAQVRERPNGLFSNVKPRRILPRGHVIDRNLALLHPLGVCGRERTFAYRIPDRAEERAQRTVEASVRDAAFLRVAVHPVAGWPTKEWRPERFAEVVRRLLGVPRTEVFLLWGPGEKERVARILDSVEGPAHLLPEMGVVELLSFLRRCDLFLGGDSGPLQMASSLGLAVVGLFGPTDPLRNGPFLGRYRVVQARVRCAPCYRRRCSRTDCMDAVSVESVWETVVRFREELEADPRVPAGSGCG